MSEFSDLSVAIVGLGLIGGSLARAMRGVVGEIVGVDVNADVLRSAEDDGVINIGFSDPVPALERADIVILCIYPQAALDFVDKYANFMREGTILTDAVGVKIPLMELCASLGLRRKFVYIGGHPLAGREVWGYESAIDDLFFERNFILTPEDGAPREKITLLIELLYRAGFRMVIETTPKNHDEIIAYTSQLPHVVAVAMCDTPMLLQHRNYTAGSFEDVTRVAKINDELWAELFLQNKAQLTPILNNFVGTITRIRDLMETNNAEGLRTLFREVRKNKELIDSGKIDC